MPALKKNEYNPNSNENYTEMGILETILINIACFVVLMGLFESNRYYKQIYLKRLQNRFQVTGRVPPYPSEKPFGWFLAIQKVNEEDVLQMVGLDAFMCLRFIALCQKFSIFLSFWGLVVLVPVYSTATSGPIEWNRYGISNLLSGTNDMKYRLWFSALFAYMFAAYFCQLLYAEYNNFSKRRLHFLVLSDPESLRRDDPDTPPQKYFTIMVERVPADMRSAELLRQYFDRLFPGDVYTVEVAVDILELDRKCQERKRVRDKLESAIAYYEAKNNRLQVHVPTGRIQEDSSIADGIFGKDGIVEFLGKVLAPTRFGVEPVDAIKHYTDKLLALNEEVKTLQGKSYEMTHALDSSIQHAMKHRQDTRAAAVIKNISAIAGAAASSNNSKKSKIKRMLFGQNFEEFKTTAKNTFKQMNLDDEAQEEEAEEEAAKTESSSHQASSSSSSSSSSNLKDDGFIHVQPTDTPDDIEAGNAESEIHTLSSRGGDATPKSRFEEELEKVRIAGEEEMKAYTNQKENTRRPSLHTVQFQDASFADSLSTNPTTQSVDVTEKVEAKKRASLPRSKPSTLTSGRDKETFLDAESKQSMALEKAKEVTKEGWEQTKLAGTGAVRGLMEMERGIEILLLGAYYKYATTAFITFNSRVTKAISYQMLLSHDSMEINHAPNPHDIIWDNVAIPKSQITMRSYITNIGVIIGSIFWSSLVNSVNAFAALLPLPHSQKLYASAVVMLLFLLGIPFVFDFLARYYEGMKLESEIQNSIMTRYFYYQLINVYVTVGFSGNNLWSQLISIIGRPQTLVDVIGGKLPDVSLFFYSLIIVKIFAAVPLEMIRPWQLSTIHLMGMFMDKRTTTRRDLRTGAFYSWPMLYGWIYPQLMMVLMIMTAYAVITPLLMPLCGIFFYVTYVMYKYQLLYVYINEYQSGGFMWYAVFGYSLVVMIFGSFAALGYLALQLGDANYSGPFYFLLPLPFSIMYFGKYCNGKFKKSSMNLSYSFARELDHKHQERRAQNKPTPHDTFQKALFRQPSLTEKEVFPEPYRNDGTYNLLRCQTTGEEVVMSNWTAGRNVGRSGSISINVHELVDEGEENQRVLEQYFQDRVLPLAAATEEEEEDDWEDGKDDEEELKIMVQKTRIIRCTIPIGNCKFSAVSTMSEKELLLFSNKKQTPVSLKALMETGKGDRLSSSSHDKNEDASRSKILIQIACFLHRELPVRLAHNAVKFEASPLIMKSDHIRHVCNWHKESFTQLRQCVVPSDSEKEAAFAKIIESIYERHSSTLITMAKGANEIRTLLKQDVETFAAYQGVQKKLDDFYMARIGKRMLMGQYLALRQPNSDPDLVGLISKKSSPHDIALQVIADAAYVCRRTHGDAPEVTIHGRTDLHFPYVSSHISYMLLELLKNSMRATVERHGTDNLPPIRIVIADGEENEDVVIKISDEGGGIRRSHMPRIWSYLYTTADPSILDSMLGSTEACLDFGISNPLAGLGYGLPISRNYARFFGGDLSILSMEGYGTDSFIHLPRLGDRETAVV